MKKNGFTFVEILAMLVVLSIIMVIAIPNISGMLKNQKLNVVKNDSTNMYETAKIKASKEKYLVKPKEGECIVFSLNYLNSDGNIEKGPNGGFYDQYDSLVLYTRVGSEYKYYIRLVEKYKESKIGISLVESVNIKELKIKDIKTINDDTLVDGSDDKEAGRSKLNSFGPITSMCSRGVISYYPGS